MGSALLGLLSSHRMQDRASLSRCTPMWSGRAVDFNIHFAAACRIMCGQLRGLPKSERLKFCLPEIARFPNNLIDRRTLELAPTGYYFDIAILSDPCEEVRWPVLFQRSLLHPQALNLCSWVCTRLETYSRSPKNPALQLLQESSKSASTTPRRPI